MIDYKLSSLATSLLAVSLFWTASTSWAAEPLPFLGNTYTYEYDGFVAEDTFVSTDTIQFTVTEGPVKGLQGEVKYQSREISPGVYLIYWQEADGGTVTHVDDFNQGISHSNYTTPDLKFYTMTGSIKSNHGKTAEHKH